MRTLILIGIFSIISIMGKAQDNFTYGTAGIAIPVLAGTINYDYTYQITNSLRLGPKFSLGAVVAGDFDGGEETAPLFATSAVMLLGKEKLDRRSAYFETNLGVQFFRLDGIDLIYNHLYVFAGARFITKRKEASNSRYFWRIGLGLPELLQFGCGVNF